MANNFIKGKDLRLSFGGKTLWHASTCTLSISTDFEEIATKDTQGKEQTPGDYAWTVSTENMVADKPVGDTTHVDVHDLIGFQLANTPITVEFTTGVTGAKIYSGTVYVQQADLTAANGSTVTGSFSFVGAGDITVETVA